MPKPVKLISHEEAIAELRQDPDFQREYELRKTGTLVAHQVYRARRALGKTSTEVAHQAGVTQRHYRAIESGDMNTTLQTLGKIARALGRRLIVTLE